MAERVVSVKMPRSLVNALRKRREADHYLDLSEQLRSVIREQCLALTNPYTEELTRFKKDIKTQVEKATAKTAKEEVLQELIRLLKEDT